jgi:hypothetical protein
MYLITKTQWPDVGATGSDRRSATPENRARNRNRNAESPNSALQRAGTHKVLSRGRPSLPRGLLPRARVLMRWRAAAELDS